MDNKIKKELNVIKEDLSDMVYNVDLIKERLEKVEDKLYRLKVGLKDIDNILIELDNQEFPRP